MIFLYVLDFVEIDLINRFVNINKKFVFCTQKFLTMIVLSFLALLFAYCHGSTVGKQYLNYSGDIMLGGLFPIHKSGHRISECGEIQVFLFSFNMIFCYYYIGLSSRKTNTFWSYKSQDYILLIVPFSNFYAFRFF